MVRKPGCRACNIAISLNREERASKMARKPRIEVEGCLYHLITRGNNRRRIFGDEDDYRKMLELIGDTKKKLPFYFYAYCLMPNHIHLLVERQQEPISRVMHRVLSAYSRYYNRKNGRVGHLFQKRYTAILCQSDQYLAELIRYIHLNPVRAKMVSSPAAFRYSSHHAYLGMDEGWLVDADPVLRHFGATKTLARERFEMFVNEGLKFGHREEFYGGKEGRILGAEEFVETTKKRVGEVGKAKVKKDTARELEGLIEAVVEATRLKREEICSRSKKRAVVIAKEALIIVGQEVGGNNAELARLIGVDSSVVSRRIEAGRTRMNDSTEMKKLVNEVRKGYTKSELDS
jgi:putative transposase